jgi:hypothetical protein
MVQLPNLPASEIKERADAIGWPLTRLCPRAGVTYATVYRAARDPARDIKRKTQVRMIGALLEIEREQLRRLAALHPDLIAELAGPPLKTAA